MVNFDAFYDRLCEWCGEEFNVKEAKKKGFIKDNNGVRYCCDDCRENGAYAARQLSKSTSQQNI